MLQKHKSIKPITTLPKPLQPSDTFLFPVNRSRYVLQSYENTYFYADGESIKTTPKPEEATTFVDVDVAFQRAQALMTVGYFVKQVVSVRCAISDTGKPVYQAQVFF